LHRAVAEHARPAVPAAADALAKSELPAVSGATTEADVLHRQRVQVGFQTLVAESREQAVYGPVKEQFGDAIRALTDAEQDSKELKSAKRHALVDQIVNT